MSRPGAGLWSCDVANNVARIRMMPMGDGQPIQSGGVQPCSRGELVLKRNRRMYERWLSGWARDVLVCRALNKRGKCGGFTDSTELNPREWSDAKLGHLLGD